MYYVSNRYYCPKLCRFLNSDSENYLGYDGDFNSYNLFLYCGNNPVGRLDPNGTDWETVAAVGLTVALIGVAILATIPTGGGSLVLASVGVSASTATAAANTAIAVGVTTACGSVVFAASENGGNDYQKARNNKQANEWAERVGERTAEALKEVYVGRNNVSRFNMLKNKKTGQIVLEAIKDGTKVFTDYFLD